MSSDIIPAQQNNIRAIDSLVANEFRVEIDGEQVAGIFTISGLISFKLEVKTTNQLKKVAEPFKITKMVQRDPHNPFNTWLRDTYAAAADIARPTRTLVIVAVDDGVEIRRWTVKKAWISEVSFSDFNSGSSEMIEETVHIRYEDIEETFALLES
ncbi:MAG: phage tail protein [Anaerolineae bacterium]|nr:phage tail protein [Anaerolineae bacterium]